MTETVVDTSPSTRRRLIMLGASVAVGALAGRPTAAVARLEGAQGPVSPLPIAIPDFVAAGLPDPGVARSVTQIITANLQRSGRFAPIDQRDHRDKISSIDVVPRFADWRLINAQALVTGRLVLESDERLSAQFRLWDVFAEQHLSGVMFSTSWHKWQPLAHVISDAIYERLTGEKGSFESSAPEITKP
jgi:TolB protein